MVCQTFSSITLVGNQTRTTRRPTKLPDFFQTPTWATHNFAALKLQGLMIPLSKARNPLLIQCSDGQEHGSTFKK